MTKAVKWNEGGSLATNLKKNLKKKLNRIVQREKLAAIPCGNNPLQNYGTLFLFFPPLFAFRYHFLFRRYATGC